MANNSSLIACDGCGLTASPAHIAERLGRLERSTRFRPVHINVLFVAPAPLVRQEDDFYGPPESNDFFSSLMDAISISASGADGGSTRTVQLLEFQRKGYYLAYLSECPLPADADMPAAVSRLNSTLIRRIRLNYRPRKIALLGNVMVPMIGLLQGAGMGSALLLNDGQPLPLPVKAHAAACTKFPAVLSNATTTDTENPVPEYDSIQVKQP